MIIYRDCESRGTPDRPVYLIKVKYVRQPAWECWLRAETDDEAVVEVHERFADPAPKIEAWREGCEGDEAFPEARTCAFPTRDLARARRIPVALARAA